MSAEWPPELLKEHLEDKISALCKSHQKDIDAIYAAIKARDGALELQAEADKKHFADLNHEGARLQAAVAQNVSRDSWDGFLAADKTWKTNADRVLQEALPKSEFQTFKESTGTAGAIRTGVTAGVSMSANTIYFVIIAAAAVGAFVVSLLLYLKTP